MSILLTLLLTTATTSLPARQRFASFKNFPVVGVQGSQEGDILTEDVAEQENVNRQARQVEIEQNSYNDELDSVFEEDNLYLTPEEREDRSIDQEYSELSYVDNDDFEYYDESVAEYEEENERQERDGALVLGRNSVRNSRRFQQSQQDFKQPQGQEQRGGRQTGQIGAATGVLSNPPSAKGDYNFK